MPIDTSREKIRELVESFDSLVRDGKIPKFSEADVGSKFILPFLEALGWDVRNIDEVSEQRRTLTGPVDYSLNVNRLPKLVVEIKRFDESLDSTRITRGKEESYPEQAIRYAWHLKVDWVVLSNFAETRLYYSHVKNPKDGLIFKLKHNEYLPSFEELWIISKESVLSGILDTHEKRRLRRDIDKEVLGNLFRCRKSLADSISRHNPKLTTEQIRESVQKILDRILVIRVSEDRAVIGSDSLWKELDSWKTRGLPTPFMRSLKSLFRDFDDIYNSKLFESHFCEDLKLDNEALESVILTLYNYNFDLISADVLGAIYEDYIGHMLKEKEEGVDIVKAFEKRRKAGIYYTPTHVVNYIVRSTLSGLKERTPEQVSELKILDPACGSGSFLIKAFDMLKEYYDAYNLNQRPRKSEPADLTKYANMISFIEKKIASENLFGVDLDSQAAEIASVNIMLKVLKKGERLPLILGDNIRIGNSLISGTKEELSEYFSDEWEKERPFEWKQQFSEVFEKGGFDVVIGNPPHGAKLTKEERSFFADNYKVAKSYKNTASLFIERSTQLLRSDGILGLVIPKSLTFSQKWSIVREFILANLKIIEIVDISKAFSDVLLEQIILLCQKKQEEIESYKGTRLYWQEEPVTHKIPISLYEEMDVFPIHVDKKSFEIYEKIRDKSIPFKKISKTSRGLPLQSKAVEEKIEDSETLLRGDDIRPYFCSRPRSYVSKKFLKEDSDKIQFLRKPKIISQRIVAHVLKPTDHIIIMSTLDLNGQLCVDTVENTIVTDPNYDLKYLLAFLNSKLVAWFAYMFIFNKAVRTMDLDDYYVGKIPIYPTPKKKQEPIIRLVDKLMRLTAELAQTKLDFSMYVNQYPRVKDKRLLDYYREVSAEDREVFIQSYMRGKINNVRVNEEGDYILIRIDYIDASGEELQDVKILKLRIEDKPLRDFLIQAVLSGKKQLGTGNILGKIHGIRLPCFNKDKQKNRETINEVIKSYIPVLKRSKVLRTEISQVERKLNQKIYACYSLEPDEISLIESSTNSDSVILSLLD
jgi:type I restriction-modification system DNA methylase subunit